MHSSPILFEHTFIHSWAAAQQLQFLEALHVNIYVNNFNFANIILARKNEKIAGIMIFGSISSVGST